jgi:hypothetical protein
MPVQKVTKNSKTVGYKFGQSGKVYKTREAAERQARAIYASGYKPKK